MSNKIKLFFQTIPIREWFRGIGVKSVGIRLMGWILLMVIAALLLFPYPSDYSLELTLRQDRNGYHTRLFWREEEGEYTENNSYLTKVTKTQISIPFQKGMLAWYREWQLVVYTDQDIGISSFDLYKGDQWRKNFSADELASKIILTDQVEVSYSTGEDYYVRPIVANPALYFDASLCQEIFRHIALHYLLDMAIVAVLLFFLVIGDRLPGLGRIYQYIGEALLRIGETIAREPKRLAVMAALAIPYSAGALSSSLAINELGTNTAIKLLVGVVLIFVLVMADEIPGIRRLYHALGKAVSSEKGSLLAFGLLLVGMVLFLFQDFLWGDKIFLYAGDSLYQTYPHLTHAAERMAAGDWGGGYTFYESLGNAEEPLGLNLRNFFAIFGREHLAFFIGVAQMLKILLAGLFFYSFLRRLGTGKLGCILLGLGFSCNSYIVARGMWQNYPNEALCLAMWLWAFEGLKQKWKRWPIFLWVSFFCYWHYNGYSAILYTGVMLLFGIFRLLSDRKKEESWGRLAGTTLLMGVLMAAGAAAAVTAWMPSLQQMLGSDRVNQGIQAAGTVGGILGYSTLPVWRTLFYRLLGPDILGIWEDTYAGTSNWLEDPVYYCGLAAVVFLPLGFAAMDKKKRRWYLLPLAGALVYNSSDVVRSMANGFAGPGWKLSSLWVIVLILIVAAGFWQQEAQPKAAKAGKVLLFTNVALVLVALLFYGQGVQTVYLVMAVTACLLLSLLLFLVGKEEEKKKKRYLQYLLIVAAAVEVVCTSDRIIHNRAGLEKDILTEGGYEDGTIELLSAIEDDSFYRVDKQFTSVSYCDSFYQRYRGAVSYIGGVGDNEYTQLLYQYMDLPILQHVQKGTEKNTVINALFNIKYALAREDEMGTYGMKYLDGNGEISLYENEYALPFGYVYDSYITEEDAWSYGTADRRSLMLEQCVVKAEEITQLPSGITQGKPVETFEEKWKEYRREFQLREQELVFERAEQGQVVVVKAKINSQAEGWCEMFCMDQATPKSRNSLKLENGVSEHIQEFRTSGADRIWLIESTGIPYQLIEAELYVIPEEVYFADYVELTAQRSEDGLMMESFSDERIEGKAVLDKDSIMVFTIPYDENWIAYVNGREQNLIHANVGFMGLALEAGEYEICLEYRYR